MAEHTSFGMRGAAEHGTAPPPQCNPQGPPLTHTCMGLSCHCLTTWPSREGCAVCTGDTRCVPRRANGAHPKRHQGESTAGGGAPGVGRSLDGKNRGRNVRPRQRQGLPQFCRSAKFCALKTFRNIRRYLDWRKNCFGEASVCQPTVADALSTVVDGQPTVLEGQPTVLRVNRQY